MGYPYRVSDERKLGMLQKGFTLIELMISILIIGLIAGGSIYFAMNFYESAKRTSTKTALQNIKVFLLNYKSEKGDYPKALPDLVKAGFLKKAVPKDAWDKPFVYRLTPDGKEPYEIYSYGPKGKGGGKDAATEDDIDPGRGR